MTEQNCHLIVRGEYIVGRLVFSVSFIFFILYVAVKDLDTQVWFIRDSSAINL